MNRLWIATLLLGLAGPGCGDRSGDRTARIAARGPASMDRPSARTRLPVRRRAVKRARPRPVSPVVRELPIKGFAPSAYVAPTPGLPGPRPVLVALHGSYGPRARECRTWGRVGARQGFVLCPAGVHRSDEPPRADRWTWGKVAHLIREIRLGLAALEKRYPGRVDVTRLTLAGFSLGSLLAHEVAYFSRGMFPRLILVEGVARLRRKWTRRIFRRGVRRVAYVCGEKTACAVQVPKRHQYLKEAGITVQTFVIPGASHGYGEHFDPLGSRILSWVQRERRPSAHRR